MNADRTRRHVLGDAIAGLAGAAVLTGAGIAIATPETLAATPPEDARLVEIAREATATRDAREAPLQVWWDLCHTDDADIAPGEVERVSDALDPYNDRLDALWEEAAELKATTREGVIAKARIAILRCTEDHLTANGTDFDEMDGGARIAFETCRDLVALGGTA